MNSLQYLNLVKLQIENGHLSTALGCFNAKAGFTIQGSGDIA